MAAPTLHYVHDPLCGWCYAVTPMVDAVANAGIPVVLHGGGLWGAATRLSPDKQSYIRQNDARIAELTGMAFGAAYLDGLLKKTDTVYWSRPTIAAVLAAGAIEQGADLRMMSAIQRAHYVEGRSVVEPSILFELASSVGLARSDFGRALEGAAVDQHIARTRRWMQNIGLRGFPGFVLERGIDLTHVDHEPFYGRPADFLHMIKALVPGSRTA